jgi:hypothetical protein
LLSFAAGPAARDHLRNVRVGRLPAALVAGGAPIHPPSGNLRKVPITPFVDPLMLERFTAALLQYCRRRLS